LTQESEVTRVAPNQVTTKTLLEFYESEDGKDIERYLDVLELLRIETGDPEKNVRFLFAHVACLPPSG